MALFLLLILVAIALGFAGVLIHGFVYLLAIGILVFVIGVFLGGLRVGRRLSRHHFFRHHVH